MGHRRPDGTEASRRPVCWRLKQAAACFEPAVIVDPSSAEGWFWLAVTRENGGREAEAIPAWFCSRLATVPRAKATIAVVRSVS